MAKDWSGYQVTGENGHTYSLVHEIGRGGFGVVFFGQDASGAQAAVKIIGPVMPEMAASSQQEVGSTIGIDHPNVLKIVDYGHVSDGSDTWFFVASEYCAGGDYRERLTKMRGHPDQDQIVEDMRQILSGLEVLHDRIVHRDIKPENILCDGDVLKLADFGLGKFVDEATRTMTFKGGGTPLYMAPETWEGKRASPATDLYAVGVILYEAFVGQPPFLGDFLDLREQHLFTPAPRIKDAVIRIDSYIDGIAKKLLAKEPKDRFSAAAEVAAALQNVTPEPGDDDAVKAIVGKARRAHDVSERRAAARRAAETAAEDSRRRIRYMESTLMDMVEDVVESVNSHLVEIKIERVDRGSERRYHFQDRVLVVSFFREGELYENPNVPGRMEILRSNNVVHGGLLEIRAGNNDREGWNVVLIRSEDEMYGTWLLVESRASALSARRPRHEPFAAQAQLLADNLACHWMRAMHIFELTDKELEREDLVKIVGILVPG